MVIFGNRKHVFMHMKNSLLASNMKSIKGEWEILQQVIKNYKLVKKSEKSLCRIFTEIEN